MKPEEQHDWNLEIFRSLADAGKGALNALIVVAGGSGAAILSFVGGLASQSKYGKTVHGLMVSLPFFYFAFVMAVVIAGMTFIAQGHYKRSTYLVDSDRTKSDEHEATGDRWSFWTAVMYVLAIVALLAGGVLAISAAWRDL